MDQSRHWHECAHTHTHRYTLPVVEWCMTAGQDDMFCQSREAQPRFRKTAMERAPHHHTAWVHDWQVVSEWLVTISCWLTAEQNQCTVQSTFFFFFNESCSDLVFKASQIKEVSRWPHSCLPVSVFCRKNIHNNKIFYFKERSGQWKITPAAINNTRRHNCRSWQQTKWKQKQHNMKLHRVQ